MREPVAANDAIWLQDTATNPMVINAVLITDSLDPHALRDAFRRRILEGPEAGRFERLRCRITGRGRHRCWDPDPEFDLARHIYPCRARNLHGLEAIQAHVGREAGKSLDADHPRWQIQVIDGFEEGATALLVRIHHSLGDGEALMDLLFTLVEAERPAHAPAPPSGVTWMGRLCRAVALPLSAPGILLRRLTWLPDQSGMHGPPLSGTKRVAWTRPVELGVVKRAKRALGATVNDVLMASVSGAFSRYLAEHGGTPPPRFLVSMPVNVRLPDQPLRFDNQFAPVPLELPAGSCADALGILAVKARLDLMKCRGVAQVIYGLQRAALACLPQAVSRGLIDFLANKCTAVVTNISGPQSDLALAGRRVRGILFWVPQRARIGIGISIMSFSGQIQVGVITDEALIPDPGELAEAFEAEFDALRAI